MNVERRRVLRLLAGGSLLLVVATAVGTGRRLGPVLRRPRIRRRAAGDLAPIPWIGHC